MNIIASEYSAPDSICLVGKTGISWSSLVNVNDVDGNTVFKIRYPIIFCPFSAVSILDVDGKTIATFTRSWAWEAYKGESTNKEDHIFTMQKHLSCDWNTKYDVFLVNSSKPKKECDFRLIRNPSASCCEIYHGNKEEDGAMMARILRRVTRTRWYFPVEYTIFFDICPNVDQAFVVALYLIMVSDKS